MKKLITSTLVLMFLFGCKKIDEKDATLYIRGRIFLKDVITTDEITASRKDFKVKLLTDTSKADYLYSTTTDADGYFIFNIPSKHLDDIYYLSSTGNIGAEEYVSINKIVTKSGDKPSDIKFDEVSLDLKLNLHSRTYLFLKTNDNVGEPVPNAKVYMYINQTMAASGNTATASYTYATNSQGELKAKDVPKGIYYTKTTAVYTSTVPISSAVYTITIGTGSVTSNTLTLQ